MNSNGVSPKKTRIVFAPNRRHSLQIEELTGEGISEGGRSPQKAQRPRQERLSSKTGSAGSRGSSASDGARPPAPPPRAAKLPSDYLQKVRNSTSQPPPTAPKRNSTPVGTTNVPSQEGRRHSSETPPLGGKQRNSADNISKMISRPLGLSPASLVSSTVGGKKMTVQEAARASLQSGPTASHDDEELEVLVDSPKAIQPPTPEKVVQNKNPLFAQGVTKKALDLPPLSSTSNSTNNKDTVSTVPAGKRDSVPSPSNFSLDSKDGKAGSAPVTKSSTPPPVVTANPLAQQKLAPRSPTSDTPGTLLRSSATNSFSAAATRPLQPSPVIPLSSCEIHFGEPPQDERAPQEWLQNSLIFYLSVRLIDLEEQQQQRLLRAPRGVKQMGGNVLEEEPSLLSSWNSVAEFDYQNLLLCVAFAVFEVNGVVLNPLFARWSNPKLKQIVSNVARTWKQNGPESKTFTEASRQMVTAVSEDLNGTITFTWLFWLRQAIGDRKNRWIIFGVLTGLSLVEILCVIFLGVFGPKGVAVVATLSAVLGVCVLVSYGICVLLWHHNTYAHAAEVFFRQEALTITKNIIQQDSSTDIIPQDSFDYTEDLWMNNQHDSATEDHHMNGMRHYLNDQIGGEDRLVSTVNKAYQPQGQQKDLYISQERNNQMLISNVLYEQYELSMQLHQQQVLRDNAINDKVGTIQDEINVTLLLYCEDHSVLSPLVLSLWSRKLLILSGTLNTLDTAYRRASERFKVFLIHAPDLAKNPLGMQLVKVWLSERRPVFFFSSDLSKFPSIAPLESCFEFPLTDQDLNTLVLRGIGMKDMEEPVEAHSPFKVPPYRLGRKLGAGAFGTVFEAEMIETGALCAVKCIYLKEDEVDDPNNPQLREIAQEVEIMSSLSHPNIVRYMFCERDDKCISIFMELCSEPPLSAMVNKEKLLDPQVVKGILLDIVSAVTYLHKKRIVHRDLKPDNVLFRDGVAKVTDFGTAVHKRRSYDLNNFKGTLTYMAPEIVVAEPYGKACDVWSIGCIAAEVLCVRLPQKGLGLAELCDFYRSLSLTKPLDVDVNVPLVKNFLQCCLQRNPKERWTAAQLLEHDLLKRENNELHRWLEYVAEQRVNASSTIDDLNDTLISEEGTF